MDGHITWITIVVRAIRHTRSTLDLYALEYLVVPKTPLTAKLTPYRNAMACD